MGNSDEKRNRPVTDTFSPPVEQKTMQELADYKPSPAWYLHNPFGIHGIGHAARVLIWSEKISRHLLRDGIRVDPEVVRWAAALHDVRRANDQMDLQHGERAAQWILENHRRGFLSELSEQQISKLVYCCTWHVPDDARIPEIIPELVCLKDADGLDRVRIFDLDPSFLRTSCAKALTDSAQRLFDRTFEIASTPQAWEFIHQVAQEPGFSD